MRNNLFLLWGDWGREYGCHFRLSEFENADGLVMVNPSVVRSLELTRFVLCQQYDREVQIIIKDAFRTEADNNRLGEKLGWTDEGGLVARDSKHLAKYGGIAVDIVARYREGDKWIRVPQEILAAACRDHFDYVKADYKDGHVHADNRERSKG